MRHEEILRLSAAGVMQRIEEPHEKANSSRLPKRENRSRK